MPWRPTTSVCEHSSRTRGNRTARSPGNSEVSVEQPRGPEPIGEILSRLFAARGWGRLQERLRLEKAWAEAAGPDIAPKTRVVALKRGVLEIEVKGAILLQELAQFHKRRILEALR